MRNRGLVLSLLSAMVLVLFGPAASAPAAIAFHGVTTAHAAGMPVATEPWRTLVEGGIDAETSFNTWTATARLGGAIPAGESVEVTWMAGRGTSTGCTPIVTFVQVYATASEDHTVQTMRTTFDPEDTIDPSDPTPICFRVSLRTGGIVSDVLEGGLAVDERVCRHHRAGRERHRAPGRLPEGDRGVAHAHVGGDPRRRRQR